MEILSLCHTEVQDFKLAYHLVRRYFVERFGVYQGRHYARQLVKALITPSFYQANLDTLRKIYPEDVAFMYANRIFDLNFL